MLDNPKKMIIVEYLFDKLHEEMGEYINSQQSCHGSAQKGIRGLKEKYAFEEKETYLLDWMENNYMSNVDQSFESIKRLSEIQHLLYEIQGKECECC